jgi:hypothetical protein
MLVQEVIAADGVSVISCLAVASWLMAPEDVGRITDVRINEMIVRSQF